jgi:hypothetical protein
VINRSADRRGVPPQANVAIRGVRAATDRTIVAQDSADDSADGRASPGDGFLRDMAAQSARAHVFDRRMRWFWLRRSLRGTRPATEVVLDLRADPVAGVGEPVPIVPLAPLAPLAPVVPMTPAAPMPRLPRQRD